MDEKNYIQILEDSLEAKIDLLRRLPVSYTHLDVYKRQYETFYVDF